MTNKKKIKNCDLGYFTLTLTLVLKKEFYPKEYMCEIWKLYL